MMRKTVLIPALLMTALLASGGVLPAQDNRAKLLKTAGDKPIEIVSDRLDAYKDKDLVQFSGNVVATQGDRVMKSDVLMIYFKKTSDSRKPEKKQTEEKGAAGASDIDRIEARGSVRITENDRIVTGDQAVLYNDEQKIVVTGNPVMKEGNNVITGDRVVVLLDENRGVVEGAAGKRVTATIYPEEAKGKKK